MLLIRASDAPSRMSTRSALPFATKTRSTPGTYRMPCGSPNPERLRSRRRPRTSTTSTESLPSAATSTRWRPASAPKWSMRPLTEGSSIVPAASSASAAAAGDAATREARTKGIALHFAMSRLLSQTECPGEPDAQLAHGLAAAVRPAHADVERQILAHAPDRADERRGGARRARGLLAARLGDRAQRPRVRALEDDAEEGAGLVRARPFERGVPVRGDGLGALRDDAGERRARPLLAVHVGKEQAELGGDARARCVLQHASAQHLLERERVVPDRAARLVRVAVAEDLAPAFEHELALARQAVVGDDRRLHAYPARAFAQATDGPELQLEVARLRHVGVGRVERPVRERGRGRAKNQDAQRPGKRGENGSGIRHEPSLWQRQAELGRDAVLGKPGVCTPRHDDSRPRYRRLQLKDLQALNAPRPAPVTFRASSPLIPDGSHGRSQTFTPLDSQIRRPARRRLPRLGPARRPRRARAAEGLETGDE